MAMLDPQDQVSMVSMEFKRYAQQMLLDADILAKVEFSFDPYGYDFLRDQIAVRMVTKLLTDDLPPEHVRRSTTIKVEEPANTWQMWKRQHQHQWFARWFVEKWPVRNREYNRVVHCDFDLTRYRAYPKARIQAPVLGNAVKFHAIENIQWDGSGE